MSSGFLAQVSAILSAVRSGVEDITPDIDIDTQTSSAVEIATYRVIDAELLIQFRNRRRKRYFYPMNAARAAEFAVTGSKGQWLKGRAFTMRGRNPASGRFGRNPRARN